MRDPRRRNRNQGTAARGHGADNRMVVPDRWATHWLDLLDPDRILEVQVGGRALQVWVERTRPNTAHPCTPSEIAEVLGLLPRHHVFGDDDVDGLAGVVLRQPTRKQGHLSPAWGRMVYFANVPDLEGPCIYLDARKVPTVQRWSRGLDVAAQEELARLETEADDVSGDARHHVLTFGAEAIRRVVLYRTLLHEVGHLVDYQEKVDRPYSEGGDFESLDDRYFARPSSEREAFAHRYAAEWLPRIESGLTLEFAKEREPARLRAQGLDPADFGVQ